MREAACRFFLSRSLLAAFLVCGAVLAAEAPPGYPARPARIIVPFAAGGGMDITARVLAKYAGKRFGERIEVVNLTAGGNIQGKIAAVRAAPDGYTLGFWSNGLLTDEFLVRAASYTLDDVRPLCLVAYDPHVIVAGKSFAERTGVRTFGQLVEYMRANPGRVTFGAGGNWTSHDFVRAKIETAAGAKFARMPFLGGKPALEATAAGNCDVAAPIVPEYLGTPEAEERVVPLAVTYRDRMRRLPGVPSVTDLGLPDLEQILWKLIAVPKHTPRSIVDYLAFVFGEAMRDPGFVPEAYGMGITVVPLFGDDLMRFITGERDYYREKTEELGIRIER